MRICRHASIACWCSIHIPRRMRCRSTSVPYGASMPLQKADSTLRTSRAVPHPSTIRALCHLTSEVERDPVHSTRYGRQRHLTVLLHLLYPGMRMHLQRQHQAATGGNRLLYTGMRGGRSAGGFVSCVTWGQPIAYIGMHAQAALRLHHAASR